MYIIPDADTLVTYLKDFTGSTNDTEIRQCIFQAELAMRNVELPALRTDPYNTFGIIGENQLMPIPTDMNKPILFFQQGTNAEPSNTGPWIVYDRIGDRDIITQGMIAQLYLSPVNVPMVIRGKFSEVYDQYQFLPWIGEGAEINMYGVYLADSGNYFEHRPYVDHIAENCKSNVAYKGALQGVGAHTVWVGDVLIRETAVGTDSYELNRNLLLTPGARADSVPNLEIETGKIEGAGHASASGRFDDEQLFYLQARGLNETEAKKLVVRGFLSEIIQKIEIDEIEQRLIGAIELELEKVGV
jgi:hypothetical protein